MAKAGNLQTSQTNSGVSGFWLIVICAVILIAAVILFLCASNNNQQSEDTGIASAVFVFGNNEKEPEKGMRIRPFLALPFAKSTKWQVDQGWRPDEDWAKIFGNDNLEAIYFELDAGTKIRAAADGYAMAFYHQVCLRMYEGKAVVEGLGRCVQIYHPQEGVFTQYGLLGEVNQEIPQLENRPTERGGLPDTWYPWVIHSYNSHDDFQKEYENCKRFGQLDYLSFTQIKKGDVLGRVLDGNPYKDGESPYNDICLRFEVFRRDPVRGQKSVRLDPFGLYATSDSYNSQELELPPTSLWLTDDDNNPIYAG